MRNLAVAELLAPSLAHIRTHDGGRVLCGELSEVKAPPSRASGDAIPLRKQNLSVINVHI